MTAINARIVPKKSSTAGEQPAPSDLNVAEIALNTADGRLFTKHTDGSIVELGGGSGGVVWRIENNGNLAYRFDGPGFDGTEDNPIIYVQRGQRYTFQNFLQAHPFQLQTIAGTGQSAYTSGVVGNQPIDDGTFVWTVDMDAPEELYYQCTSHDEMSGVIRVVGAGGAEVLGDLDDVKGQAAFYEGFTNGYHNGTSMPTNDGYWGVLSNGTGFLLSSTQDSDFGNLAIPEAITFEVGEDFSHTTNVDSVTRFYTTNTYVFDVVDAFPEEWRPGGTSQIPVGASVRIFAASFPQQPLVPYDGQVLTWSDSESLWVPESLPVTSVNGQTGDVDLGIQDMNDFELNVQTGSTASYSTNIFAAIDDLDTDGEYTRAFVGVVGSTSSANSVVFWNTDDNGNSIADLFTNDGYTNGDNIYVSTDNGVNWTTYATTAAGIVTIDSELFAVKSSTFYNASGSGSGAIVISVLNPQTVNKAPLADGDHLEWDDTAGKFMPVQLADVATSGDYNDLINVPSTANAVTSVNSQTGDVVLDMEDLDNVTVTSVADDDVLRWNSSNSAWENSALATVATSGDYNDLSNLPEIPADIEDLDDVSKNLATYSYTVVFNANPAAQGEARLTANTVGFYITDNGGIDTRSHVIELPDTGSFEISTDNVNFSSISYTQKEAIRSDGWTALADYSNAVRFILYTSSSPITVLGVASSYTGALYVRLPLDPYNDGDLLVWNDGDSSWKPVGYTRVVGGSFGSGL